MKTSQLIKEQKRQGEETEFYPTTFEIVDRVARWLSIQSSETHSILDIGCGNGNFFEKLDQTKYFYDRNRYGSRLFNNYKKYGIEKSNILAEQLPDDVILLGSDFYTNTLIDKKVDCIFCNPPYSDFELWAEKIIKEGNTDKIVLVIPERWKNSEQIKEALNKRKYITETIGSFDFYHAERKARAVVEVVGITPNVVEFRGAYYNQKYTDPFDVWFESTFSLNADKTKEDEFKEKEKKRNEVIQQGDTAEMLVKFYNDDMAKLYSNYRSLETLDAEIFKELKVDVEMLKKSLRERLKNLKIFYWDLLFKKYDKLTQRLTTAGRDKVIKRLNDNTAIDFTLENIFQLTLWIIRHSNTLFDEQLTDFFFTLSRPDNIHRYKSNLRWNDSSWRYIKDNCTEYGTYRKEKAKKLIKNVVLDYRVIVTDYSNFDTSWHTRLSDSCREFLYDLTVIGANLGYRTELKIPEKYEDVDLSEWGNFDIMSGDEVFCNVKLYKNGNRHLKFCQSFMKKLNLEMARINGWIHSKEQAKEEMGLTEAEVNQFWKNNIKIGIGEGRKLVGLPEVDSTRGDV